jgi:site-specific DNA recombinase
MSMIEKKNENKTVPGNTVPPEKYAAIYARQSILKETFSLKTQEELAKEKIRENNLVLFDIYSDEESATRYSPFHRQGFKRLLCDAYNGHFKTLVVFRRDRLARKVEDLLEIRKIFRKLGIKVIYSSTGEFQPEEENHISSFVESILISIAELEPTILAQRVRAGKQEKRESKLYDAAIPPFGLQIEDNSNSKYKEYILEKNKAEIIEEIFNMYLYPENYEELDSVVVSNKVKNELIGKITKIVNQKYSNILSKPRSANEVTKYILNPIYAALMTKEANKSPISILLENNSSFKIDKDKLFIEADNVKPIVSEQIWFDALIKLVTESTLDEPLNSDEDIYIFKDLLYCTKCKCKIVVKKEIYQCKNKCTFLDKDSLESFLLRKFVLGLVTRESLLSCQNSQLKKLEEELKVLENDIQTEEIEQQYQIDELLKETNFNNPNIFKPLIDSIDKENNIRSNESFCLKKEKITQMLITDNIIDELKESESISAAVSCLRRIPEYTNGLLKRIIEKRIYIAGKSKEELYEQYRDVIYRDSDN